MLSRLPFVANPRLLIVIGLLGFGLLINHELVFKILYYTAGIYVCYKLLKPFFALIIVILMIIFGAAFLLDTGSTVMSNV